MLKIYNLIKLRPLPHKTYTGLCYKDNKRIENDEGGLFLKYIYRIQRDRLDKIWAKANNGKKPWGSLKKHSLQRKHPSTKSLKQKCAWHSKDTARRLSVTESTFGAGCCTNQRGSHSQTMEGFAGQHQCQNKLFKPWCWISPGI